MTTRPLFLKWLLLNVLVIFAVVVVGFTYWHSVDALGAGPKFALVVLAFYFAFAAACGKLIWKSDEQLARLSLIERPLVRREVAKGTLTPIARDADHIQFGVNFLPMAGMVGTVTGFLIVVVGGFGGTSNIQSSDLPNLMQHVGNGAGTALVSTLVGLLGALLLSIQLHVLDHALNEHLDD